MDYLLGRDWEIYPAGGATGEAFLAKNNDQKLFLKRNSSPFLAVLSAEGIVPKLVWTKRLENGDVITAQHWLNSRELKPDEMNQENVAKLLWKIHQSHPLLNMLKRMGKTPLKPEALLEQLQNELDKSLAAEPVIQQSLSFLEKELEYIKCEEWVVCHSDVNHNNWLLSQTDELYLIDWDGAMIADPAIDLGMLLYWYIPKQEWADWLRLYGIDQTHDLELRMKWYVICQTILSIQWHMNKERIEESRYWLESLKSIIKS
ncbi:thiamine kinase-like enzyme [Peribacillus deserti]|uniref:Thiamine kinase-like enzyme n=1 Tax=Peribacillus deserti TaxID=673318 RepID=A0ABS2QJH6_9BACI|nr:phosphotransferase family protein [Peribacillus deserti]MBM7692939.1 thiamine kinase-like enzyme [Peribacillus deserti]